MKRSADYQAASYNKEIIWCNLVAIIFIVCNYSFKKIL